MKNLLLILIIASISTISYSQNPRLVFSNKNLATYKQATTMVMLKENNRYHTILKRVIEKNWTFNKYEFTTEEKLKTKYKEKSPLPILGFIEGYSDYVGTNESSRTLGIQSIGFATMFKSKKYYNMENKEVVHAFSLNNIEDLKTEKSIEAFFTVIIQDLNNYLIVLGNPDNKVHSRKSYWNYTKRKDIKSFKNKKILLSKKDSWNEKFMLDEEAAKKYNYQFVSEERITEAILNNEDVLIYYSDNWGHINWAKNGELIEDIIRSKQNIMFKEFRERQN